MSDTRTYIKLHDGMPDHPKIEPLSDRAFRALIELWCWCSRHLTDGHVTKAVWEKRTSPKVRRELMAGEHPLVETTETGIFMHDYLDHQRSKAEVDSLRAARQAAGKRGGEASARWRQNSKQTLSKIQPVSETDTETEKEPYSPPPSEEIDTASSNGGGGESASHFRTIQAVTGALVDQGYTAEELKPGIDILTLRFRAGEAEKVTSPLAYVKSFADQYRGRLSDVDLADAEPAIVDGVPMVYREGRWEEAG